MERDCIDTAEKTKPASPLRKNINEEAANSPICGATDVAKARWTLLRQVLRQKQTDAPEVKQVSVRRFATFDLFSRKRLLTQDPSDTLDDQWVEYRSVFFPEYSALLRDNMGPIRVNEVLNSFDNTGNVCPPSQACVGLGQRSWVSANQPDGSIGLGSEVKVMARGYFTAHWDQTI
ncbi:hypothetical protein KUCAC02_024495 [Chaenocephalus aceratus]|uniref:Uncharacterized protein n=1 Tax=Chaenocephalus aceratus TaxID=36190 RepID=A0ACB9WJ48_CHAAC|nr:hypothetical protein KUCAC02_024495 [Chaenocephalus aceratus]